MNQRILSDRIAAIPRPIRQALSLLIILMLLVTVWPVAAQNDGDNDPLEQAIATFTAAYQDDTYTFETAFESHIVGTVNLNGNTLQSIDELFITSESGTVQSTATDPQVRRVFAVENTVSVAGQPPYTIVANGEIRVVEGDVYVNTAYEEASPDLPALLDGWTTLTEEAPILWPGLDIFVDVEQLLERPAANVALLDVELPELQAAMREHVTSINRTTDEESGHTLITMTGTPPLARAFNIYFNAEQSPEEQLILEAMYQSLLAEDVTTITFTLDETGHLIQMDVILDLSVTELDISDLPEAPAGLTITLSTGYTYTATLNPEPDSLEAVAVPEGVSTETFTSPLPEGGEMFWWNDRTFYEIFVRSFYDSNGDGIGDLQGVIEKLDYLNDGDPTTTDDLNITGIWLMPVAQSPSYHGYDVTDYFTIEDDYGTNEDFLELVEAAHERGIVIIVDLVLNHTSSQHPWFLAAQEGDPTYEDWYIWTDTPPDYRSPWGSPVWHPIDEAGSRYYYGLFWEGMPDLNYNTPEVTEQMNEVIRFWLEDMNADGFRLDAIRHLYEDGPILENTPETYTWLENFDEYVHTIAPDALTIGEVWDTSEEVAPYITGDRVDIAFEFDLAGAIMQAADLGTGVRLYATQADILALYPPAQYSTFLTNHDQNRVMSQLEGDTGAAKVAASVLLTSPGVPFVYYGEEIGMEGVKPDERIRTPMAWTGERTRAGFTEGTPWQILSTGYSENNVATLRDDPDSLFNHYRTLLQLRGNHAALRTGSMQLVGVSDSGLYAFLRYGEDETLLVLVNLSRETVDDYTLSLAEGLLAEGVQASLLFGEGDITAPVVQSGGFVGYTPLPSLPPQSTFIISLQAE